MSLAARLRRIRIYIAGVFEDVIHGPAPVVPDPTSLDDFESLGILRPDIQHRRERIEGVPVVRVTSTRIADVEALRQAEERVRAAGYDCAREPHALIVTARRA